MFKGACRLDDPVHRIIILSSGTQVKNFRFAGLVLASGATDRQS